MNKETGITVSEASIYLGISQYTIRKLVRTGKISNYGGVGKFLFTKKQLDKWIDKQEQKNSKLW